MRPLLADDVNVYFRITTIVNSINVIITFSQTSVDDILDNVSNKLVEECPKAEVTFDAHDEVNV